MSSETMIISDDKTVINHEGANYYKACEHIVAIKIDGVRSYCVKRIGHPGILHEDFDGNVNTNGVNPSIADIVSPNAPMTTNEKGGRQSDIPVRFDLIDGKALFEMAKVLDHGAKKYGENNWRQIDIFDHLNHLLMHTYAYLSGDTTDEHLSHILCRATFALGVELQEDVIDPNN